MSTYDVTATNTNRLVRFMVEGHGGSSLANIFAFNAGPSAFYPRAGRTATPTNNQLLAQLRVSLVVRGLSVYMPPAYVSLATDSASHANGAIVIGWEADQMGVFFNNAWMGDTTVAKHVTTDIVDVTGTGGMSSVKTKPGLATLLSNIATRSFDGGTTGPFGALSAGGNIVLPTIMGGGTSSGAPDLNTGQGAGFLSGLQITLV